MITNPKKTCLVLDLDDTLYKEYDYQTSGLKYIEKKILDLYDINIFGKLLDLRDQGVSDLFHELTKMLKLPTHVKKSFIAMYHHHTPDISLSLENEKFINSVLSDFGNVVILTDGRSISQRSKLKSLNLSKIPVYISEEWDSLKPDKKRFLAIMESYSDNNYFCYVADNPSKDFITPNSLLANNRLN